MGCHKVRPRCTWFFRVLANKAGIKHSECIPWKQFFGSELVISGKQLCGWPDDLPIQCFSEMDYHEHTTEDWQWLWAACLQKTVEIVDVDANRLLANALVVTKHGDTVLLKSQSTHSSSTTRKQGHNEIGSDPDVPTIQPLLHAEARARFSLSPFLLLFSRDHNSLIFMSSLQQ